jgi:hypothetical protein
MSDPNIEPTPEPARRPSSQARIDSNRNNALKSTGPRTQEGKDKSRLNALKHGLCAITVHVEGESTTLLDERRVAWGRELNPRSLEFDGYMVDTLARDSIKLDRCYYVRQATLAQLARDAVKAEDEEVRREAENLLVALCEFQDYCEVARGRGLGTDWVKQGKPIQPGHAVRRLKQTSIGCKYLLAEWDRLRPTLIDPANWDNTDQGRAINLMGYSTSARDEVASPLVLPTRAITAHRDCVKRIELNKKSIVGTDAYKSPADRQRDLDNLPGLAAKAAAAKLEVEAFMAREEASIRMTMERLEVEEALSKPEATYRARFDGSEKGRLMNRYEGEARREFNRTAELLMRKRREDAKAAQGVSETSVAYMKASADASKKTVVTSRNEAIERVEIVPSGRPQGVRKCRKGGSKRAKSRQKRRKHQR